MAQFLKLCDQIMNSKYHPTHRSVLNINTEVKTKMTTIVKDTATGYEARANELVKAYIARKTC